MSREEELNYLKKQAQAVKDDLERINARVQDLESTK
jgi:prefoldin subunit 5